MTEAAACREVEGLRGSDGEGRVGLAWVGGWWGEGDDMVKAEAGEGDGDVDAKDVGGAREEERTEGGRELRSGMLGSRLVWDALSYAATLLYY